MTYQDELDKEKEYRIKTQQLSRILDRLERHGACENGMRHIRWLGAYTSQEIWDAITDRPFNMTWWIDELHEKYEDPTLVEPSTRTSLAVAFARLHFRASPTYHELVDEVAVSNAYDLPGHPSFVITEHILAARSSGLISLQEETALSALREVLDGEGYLGTVVYIPGCIPRAEQLCTLIRMYFPTVPVPTEAQEDRAFPEAEGEE